MKIVIGLYIFDYLTGGERSNILVNGESWFKVHSRRRHAHHAPTLMLVSSMAEPSFLHKVSVGTESFESMTLHSPPFVVPFVKCFSGCFVAFIQSFIAFTSFFNCSASSCISVFLIPQTGARVFTESENAVRGNQRPLLRMGCLRWYAFIISNDEKVETECRRSRT